MVVLFIYFLCMTDIVVVLLSPLFLCLLFSSLSPPPPPPPPFSTTKKRLATVDKVLEEIRGGLSRRGVYAFIKLRRLLARRDYNNTGMTNLYDLTEVLRSLGLSVRDGDLVNMVRRYDPRQEGKFDYNAVLSAIRGDISNVRLAVVRKAFDKVCCF